MSTHNICFCGELRNYQYGGTEMELHLVLFACILFILQGGKLTVTYEELFSAHMEKIASATQR